MKHKLWDKYYDAVKWQVCKKEAFLETHKATKEDMANMIRFLVEVVDPNLRADFEDELKAMADRSKRGVY